MSFSANFHDKCDIKGVTLTFPSEKSHIHLGLGGLGTSWRYMADSRTLGWKVLPSHMDCSWLTTVPVQLRMPEKRPATKDIFVEWNGLLSGKHRASTDYTSLAVWTISLLFWKVTSNTLILSTDSKNSNNMAVCSCCTKSFRKHCFLAKRTLFWKHNRSQKKVQSMPY